ncbi:hypothetical protein NQ317_003397 [Molorchus minor]|uniref:Uncharacterized protein n=1 Tax=Molorchus minor TaxID=1323400 RepID=A0ABQ9K7U9_9CUCU|nr:hypothetical protein NQ317_003397 [Molorchus minor]
MITVSLSLALCTVMFRRFLDSFAGRIPVAVQSSTSPNATALFMFSGALYYLYNHLRKGTLVRIGQGRQRNVGRSTSLLTIQRRPKNNSWFLRNARACRKRCTDAVYKIAKQSYESLHSLNPCVLLPNRSFHISFSKSVEKAISENTQDKSKNVCNIIYSNDAFNKECKEGDKAESQVKIIETPLTCADDIQTSIGNKKKLLKRLCEVHARTDDEIGNHQRNRKKNKKIKRMTRSGRIYAIIE